MFVIKIERKSKLKLHMNQPFCFLLLYHAQNQTLRKPAYTTLAS